MLRSTVKSISITSPLIFCIPSLTLLLAWVWARWHRPDQPDHIKLTDLSQGWPSWYGPLTTPFDPVETNDIPFDTGVGEPSSLAVRILVDADVSSGSPLIPYIISLSHYLASVEQDHDVIWGEDSPDWERHCSKGWEAVWRISDKAHGGGGHTCPGVPMINEVHSLKSDPLLYHSSLANITILPHPRLLLHPSSSHSSLSKTYGNDSWSLGLITSLLPAADSSVFYPDPRLRYPRAVTYFPNPDTPPQQRPKLPYDARWSTYAPNTLPIEYRKNDVVQKTGEVEQWWIGEEKRRAETMRKAGICLFDSWKDGLDVDMAQAMLSGCVVASAVPDIHHSELNSILIPLNTSSSLSPINQINALLPKITTSELHKKRLEGFVFARRYLTLSSRVAGVKEVLGTWKNGERGYMLPHGAYHTCQTSRGGLGWCDGTDAS